MKHDTLVHGLEPRLSRWKRAGEFHQLLTYLIHLVCIDHKSAPQVLQVIIRELSLHKLLRRVNHRGFTVNRVSPSDEWDDRLVAGATQ